MRLIRHGAGEPVVRLEAKKPPLLLAPDLHKLGEAFVDGHIRVEGSIHELFRVAESLVSSVAAKTRSRFHLFTHHSPQRDRKAIEYTHDEPIPDSRCSR